MGNFGRDNRGGGRSFGGNRGGHGGFGGGRGRDFGRGFNQRSDRHEMFSATCSECGKACQVPFRPTNGKPVYCSECFEKINGGSDRRKPQRNDFTPRPQGNDQSKAQLDAINAKLDKILSILVPSPVVETAESVKTEVEEVKEKKVKKASSKKKE